MMDKRFEAVDKRIEAMYKRFQDLRIIMLWLAGVTSTSLLATIGMLVKLLLRIGLNNQKNLLVPGIFNVVC